MLWLDGLMEESEGGVTYDEGCFDQTTMKRHRFLLGRFSGRSTDDWWRPQRDGDVSTEERREALVEDHSPDSYIAKNTLPVSVPLYKYLFPDEMEFSKFRDSGELSDITVTVDGKQFFLHKFPLYIKSDFFRALARSSRKDGDAVILEEFPGGTDTFALVANYFYNVKIDITKENVCKLRCAAEFLQMGNTGNLAPLTDKFLQDILTTAKLGHDVSSITDLVLQCVDLGPIAEQAGIVDKCLLAIVDCWLISSKYGTKRFRSHAKQLLAGDTLKTLCQFPLKWFKELFVLARDKSVHPEVLAKLVQSYISAAAKRKQPKSDGLSESQTSQEGEDTDKRRGDVSEEPEVTEEGVSQETKEEKGDGAPCDADTTDDKEEEVLKDVKDPNVDLELGTIMDTLLFEVQMDNTAAVEEFSRNWVVAMLQIAETINCKSRDVLLKLLGRMLHRLNKEDLSELSPDMLSEIIAEGCQSGQTDSSAICRVMDEYLSSQAEQNQLTVDMFKKLVESVPKDSRANHDTLFEVLETVLKGNSDISEETKQELLETVDFGRLSESTLQRAFDSGLVPVQHIARAALGLCAKLRNDLDKAHETIRRQEEVIEKFEHGSGVAGYPSAVTIHAGSGKKLTPSKQLHTSGTDHIYESSYPKTRLYPGATPSLASDLELTMALESLDRSMERTRLTKTMTDAAPIPDTMTSYNAYLHDDRDDAYKSTKPYKPTYTLTKSYNGYHKS